jgi:hypothetical protein
MLDLHPSDIAFLDMDELIKICFVHQTKQALTGVHTHATAAEMMLPPGKQKQSQKQQVQMCLNELIKGLYECGVRSRLAHAVQWQNRTKKTGVGSEAMQAGNAVNSAETTNAQAKKVFRFLTIESQPMLTASCTVINSMEECIHKRESAFGAT